MENTRPPTTADDIADREPRGRLVQAAVYEYLTRRDGGEPVSAETFGAAHPDLMPELAAALAAGVRQLRQVIDAGRAAAAAGDGPPLRPPTTSGGERPPPGPAPRGPRIQGYCVTREISGGGQGTVFEAVHATTGRTVAVKVVTGASGGSIARFEREAWTLAALSHPGIVGIIDRGRTADGAYYLAMEYVAGRDLDAWVAAQRSPGGPGIARDVVALFARVAAAVQAAHRQGVVHRDLKPSNVRVDDLGNPRVVDFGLAHLAGDLGGERRLTVTGNIIGSVPWASPEQAAGDVARLGPPSDVYSLGVLLYHALTGRFPYEVRGPLHQVTRNICLSPPADPRRAGDGGFGPVDATLAAVLLRCLRKSPAGRFADAGELAATLERYLAGDLPAPPASWRRRRRTAAAAAVGLMVVVAATIVGARTRRPGAAGIAPRGTVTPAALPSVENSVGMTFTRVPAGRFRMGSARDEQGRRDDEAPHVVRLTRPYWVGRTEVTRAQFRRVMGHLPPGVVGGDEGPAAGLPVDHVSWLEATEFCRRLGETDGRTYRLPSEAEWEYACRAGTQGAFAGNGVLTSSGWFAGGDGGDGGPRQVASKAANHWGLYDMHGNVAEWTADRYVPHLGSDERVDPAFTTGDASYVVRGGSASDHAADCRSASRASRPPDAGYPGVGFRVVMSAAPSVPDVPGPGGR